MSVTVRVQVCVPAGNDNATMGPTPYKTGTVSQVCQSDHEHRNQVWKKLVVNWTDLARSL